MIRRNAWHPVSLESVQLVAGYRAARHLQALELPPRLSKEVANFICRLEGELAERKIPAADPASAPESYDDMSDAELAGQARALRVAIVTLPATSARRDVLAQEWRSRMDELARRAASMTNLDDRTRANPPVLRDRFALLLLRLSSGTLRMILISA